MTTPTTWSYTLAPATLAPAPVHAPAWPAGAAIGSCVPRYFTQQDLLDLLERIFPESYLESLKSPGPGYEMIQMFSKIMERVSLAIGRMECGAFFTTAAGGNRATVNLEFIRQNASAGAVTVLNGTVVRTSRTGRRFVLQEDVVFGALDVGPEVGLVEAVQDAWEYNVQGQRITAAGEVLPGEIDTIDKIFLDPPFGDQTIRVQQIADAIGGQSAMLDGLGDNRNIPRLPGETDIDYSGRTRLLPDVITPDAIVRRLNKYLNPLNISYQLIETWEITYQTCWDGPGAAIVGSDYDPDLFCYDDPRPATPFRNRWLDAEDYRGAIIVVVPNIAAVSDVGMAYDDTALTLADHETDRGVRAHNAYDNDPFGNVEMLQGGYDGFDLGKNSIYKELYDMLVAATLAGVAVAVELEGE